MVKFSAAAGVAGLWFLIWQLWRQQRAAKSLETYAFESSGAAANLATPLEAARIAREANAPPARFLSVNTFDFKNLEVRLGGSGRGCGGSHQLARCWAVTARRRAGDTTLRTPRTAAVVTRPPAGSRRWELAQ